MEAVAEEHETDCERMHAMFEAQARRNPDAVAVVDGERRLTYAELNARANRLAHYLRDSGIAPDLRVGICMSRGAQMIVALLATLKAGGAYVPLDPAYPSERLGWMLEDAQPLVVLSDEIGKPVLAQAMTQSDVARTPRVLDVEADAALWREHSSEDLSAEAVGLRPSHLGYLIYTSGSTGRPKGVAIEHRNAVNLVIWALAEFTAEELRNCLFSTSINFDLSIFECFVPLSCGATVTVVENALALLSEPLPVTLINTVPSVMEELTRADAIPPEVRVVNVAGEVLKRSLAERILASAHVRRLCNLYGPSETTTYSTWASMGRATGFVAHIGRPVANTRVYVLDENRRLVAEGETGEIYIGGEGVARGYLNHPALTAERFIESPFRTGERMYKTGDLGRWLADGNLEYQGRNDFQVKIRGFRIELGEVETRLSGHPDVREAVALAREDAFGDKRLVVYYLSDTPIPTEILRRWMSEALPTYMVPSAYVRMESWPLTANGKLDRKALPDPGADAYVTGAYTAPEGETECALSEIWSELLGVERIGRDDGFLALGGDSLKTLRLAPRIRERLGRRVSASGLFKAASLRAMAELVESSPCETGQETLPTGASFDDWVRPDEMPERCPVSYQQHGLWLLEKLSTTSLAYNSQNLMRVSGEIDRNLLQRAVDAVIARHEIFRTTFHDDGGSEPYQRVHPRADGVLIYRELPPDADDAELDRVVDEYVERPFDLSRLPLVHLVLIKRRPGEAVMFHIEQHYVHDGWSVNLFLRELMTAYTALARGEAPWPAELPAQYRDYALWQRSPAAERRFAEGLAYWKTQLAGVGQSLPLRTDHPRPRLPSYRGEQLRHEISPNFAEKIKRFSEAEGVTLYAVMLTAFQVLLRAHTGSDDFLLGSAVANRKARVSEGMLGMFVNMMVVRSDLRGEPTFREMIGRTMETLSAGYEYQEVPFEHVVKALQPAREAGKNPLFQVAFSAHNSEGPPLRGPGFELRLHEVYSNLTSKFDFDVIMVPRGFAHRDGLTLLWSFAQDLFERETMQRMLENYLFLLERCLSEPGRPVSQLPLMGEAERHRLIEGWNATDREYPCESCVPALFEAQVRRNPDAVAVVEGEHALTYAELNARANALAHRLIEQGVVPESRVAICMERSLAMVIGFLGILKAGGAYVPIDPTQPVDRVRELLHDCAPTALVTRDPLRSSPWAVGWPVLTVESDDAPRTDDPQVPGVGGRTLAYVIYTSGSTGEPKGVMVEHRSVLRLVINNPFTPLKADDCVVHCAHPAFDATTWELWGALLNGARVLVVSAVEVLSPTAFAAALSSGGASAMFMTSGLFNEYVDVLRQAFARMRYVLTGGDVLDPRKMGRALEEGQRPQHLIACYGPTETTTFATTYPIEEVIAQTRTIPIGRPIGNTRVYVLDANRNPVPVGVTGEIYIGGDGVARGYWNRPELTAERFIENPFRAGDRLYKTGDLGYWRADGVVEFVGRNDFQVKIRGFRIELGEIEAKLSTVDGVREAVVVAWGEDAGRKQLVAYYLSDTPLAAGMLRESLSRQLPEYMVPAAFVRMEAWPLTSSGKLDRKVLPEPEGEAYAQTAYEAPNTPVEQALAAIWSRLLGVERIGVRDNFFALGGHSVLGIRLMMELDEVFGVELSLRDLFENPTLEQLVGAILDQVAEEMA